ncbi:MAG: tetratricopeptide repeat protein [Bacteroidota bacterium]|nr:tetratricopeptide repeat protein [Bacteroidota bacterium]
MNKIQLIVLSGAILIFVLIFFAPKSNPFGKEEKVAVVDHDLETHFADFKEDLQADQREMTVALEQSLSIAKGENRLVVLDSLVHLWELNKNPAAAAIYALQKAEIASSLENWLGAAERFFYAARFADNHLKHHVYNQAIRSYEEVLKLQPENVDAKINLAVCYVENSVDPMKGIGLLREVLANDSLNVKAHLNLGYFSVKSGQFDKAIERFEKVIEINPDYVEAYLYLGDVYETKGDNEKAIKYYEKYKDEVKNPSLSAEIGNYIEKLK